MLLRKNEKYSLLKETEGVSGERREEPGSFPVF
jgi:hypothetical protein